MRFRWRKRTKLAANYKTVIDAFIEGYHTPGTHPQTLRPAEGPRPHADPAPPQEFAYAPYTPTIPYPNHSRFIYTARPDSGNRDVARKELERAEEAFEWLKSLL